MRSRWLRAAVPALLAGSFAACSDSIGPDPQDRVDLLLDFCSTEIPVFFAYQNQGGAWTRVTPDAEGTVSFQASPRVALAIVHQSGSSYTSEYIYTTAAEVAPLSGVACAEQAGTRSLSGSVANLPVGTAAMISMAGQFDYITSPDASYALSALPSGPRDLVAHRETVTASEVFPDRIIIRRAQDFVNGATIPTLDFNSTEARSVAEHGFTASGLSGNDDNYYLLNFSTQTTRRHSLSTAVQFFNGSPVLYGVPTTLTQAGDLHELEVFADGGSSYRGETQYYRFASQRSVALGPALTTPQLSTVATSPYLRLRTQLPAQSAYGTLVSVVYEQNSRDVVVTLTAGHVGNTPSTWEVTIPDLSGVPGFPLASTLQSGIQSNWYVDAYGGGFAATFFGSPADGDVLRYAGRASVASTMQRSETRGGLSHSPLARRRARTGGAL